MLIIAVLWTSFFLINLNVAVMIPLLPFIERSIGLSNTEAGLVLAAFPVVALVSNLVIGPFIDRLGRKNFIITGAGACALLFLLTATARNGAVIGLCRAATGIFMPMVGASIFAALADYVPRPDRMRVSGYVTTAAPIAFLVAMSVGTWLGGLLSWQAVLRLVGVMAGGLALAALLLPPTPVAARASGPVTAAVYRQRLLSLSLNRETRLILLSYFTWSAAIYTFLGRYPTWLAEQGLAGHGSGAIGAMLFCGEIGGLIGAFYAGRLERWFVVPFRLCAWAAGGLSLLLLILPWISGHVTGQGMIYGLIAFGRDLMLALILGGAMRLVAAEQRGSLNAIMNALYQSGATLGGIASAALYAGWPDLTGNTLAAAGLLALCAVMLWSIGQRRR